MKFEKVIAKEVFTSEDYYLLNKNSYDILVCNELSAKQSLPPDLKIVLSDSFRIEGTWETYKHNTSVVNRLITFHSNIFQCADINILPAVSKLVYWTNYKTGSVKKCLKTLFNNCQIDDFSSFSLNPKYKGIVKFLLQYFKNLYKSISSSSGSGKVSIPKGKIGILVNDTFEMELYYDLIKHLESQSLIVFHYGNLKPDLLNQFKVGHINLKNFTVKKIPFWINPFFRDRDELHVCNVLQSEWFNISDEIARYQVIKQTGISQLIINEGENRPLRNLLKPVLGDDVQIYNTMNGIKAGEAQDKDVNFDKWLVWDETMKQLFIDKCGLPESMFEVVGHLAEDFKMKYQFSNTLGINLEELKGKKIISVISVRGNRKEKSDLKQLLETVLNQENDIYIILKPHPLEKSEDFMFKSSIPNKLFIVPDKLKNNKDALYDILILSDLSVVFGSTVALESSWFKTPCITFEYRMQPLVAADGLNVQHVREIDVLKTYIKQLKHKAIEDNTEGKLSVSKRISDIVIQTVLEIKKKKTDLNEMILARNLLRKVDYEEALKKGVKRFLFNEIDFLYEEENADEFYNCTQNRVQSTWMTWKENERVIENFKRKSPQLFNINGVDITLAIQKAMFWSNYKTGFLWYAYKEEYKDRRIYSIDPMHKASRVSTLLRYVKTRSRSNQPKTVTSVEKTALKVVHLKSDFQLGLYQNFLIDIKDRLDYLILVDSKVNKDILDSFNLKNCRYLDSSANTYRVPSVNFLNFTIEDWFAFNIILIHWDEICESLQTANSILKYNPSLLLINEGENGIYGAVLSEVMKTNGVEVFNSMNGIKSGESQDAFVNFDKWFIWDEQMKKLLMEKNHLSEEKLIVSGHLMEDMVRNYQYQNSLNIDLEQLKGKKVISLFSVRGRRFVKMQTLEYFFDLIRNDKSYFLLLRPHPSEKKEDYILPEEPLDNFLFIEYGKHEVKDTLHDQLYVSDLSIVFGSTVALDSKWMGVPCITYERRDDSLVYCVDNDLIFHVKTLEELTDKMKGLLNAKRNVRSSNVKTVSNKIIEILDQHAAQSTI